MKPAYYNEIDPFAAQWLRNLIDAGHIAFGIVDERSIEDVRPEELRDFGQCHFFAGIGVWAFALRRAGVPDDAYAAYAETGFPLAHGAPARVGRLRAYGNAINAEQARIFIECCREAGVTL